MKMIITVVAALLSISVAAQASYKLVSVVKDPTNVNDNVGCPALVDIEEQPDSVVVSDTVNASPFVVFGRINQGAYCTPRTVNGGIFQKGYMCSLSYTQENSPVLSTQSCETDLPLKCNPVKKPQFRWNLWAGSSSSVQLQFECLECARELKTGLCTYVKE